MRKLIFVTACLIVIITVIIEAMIFLRVTRLPFIQLTVLGATHSLTHWVGWIGTLYIAFTAPLLPVIKRKASRHYKAMLNIHIIGNLTSCFTYLGSFCPTTYKTCNSLSCVWHGNGIVPNDDFTCSDWSGLDLRCFRKIL